MNGHLGLSLSRCDALLLFLLFVFAFSLLCAIIWIHGSGASTSKPKFQTICFCGVGQSGSPADSYSVGRGFKSHPRYQFNASLSSRWTVNPLTRNCDEAVGWFNSTEGHQSKRPPKSQSALVVFLFD